MPSFHTRRCEVMPRMLANHETEVPAGAASVAVSSPRGFSHSSERERLAWSVGGGGRGAGGGASARGATGSTARGRGVGGAGAWLTQPAHTRASSRSAASLTSLALATRCEGDKDSGASLRLRWAKEGREEGAGARAGGVRLLRGRGGLDHFSARLGDLRLRLLGGRADGDVDLAADLAGAEELVHAHRREVDGVDAVGHGGLAHLDEAGKHGVQLAHVHADRDLLGLVGDLEAVVVVAELLAELRVVHALVLVLARVALAAAQTRAAALLAAAAHLTVAAALGGLALLAEADHVTSSS